MTLFVSIKVGVLLRRSCHCTLLQCKAGNRKLLPIAYERYSGPVQVVQKQGHKCNISGLATRNQVGRHGLYPGHYSGIFALQECMKRRNQASVRGCTQSYYSPYRLQQLAPTPALVFSRNHTPNLSYLKRQSNHSATSAADDSVAVVDKERMGRRNIVRLDIRKRVIDELIWVRPPMEG